MRCIATLILAITLCGCDQSVPSGDDDAGADVVPQNPLDEIDVSTIVPANGTVLGPTDEPLHVSFRTPGILPGYTGTVPTDVDASVTATGDAATPADGGDDWTAEVFTNVGVPLEQLTAGSTSLASVNSGAGVQDQERITLHFTVTSVRPAGTFTREAEVVVTYSSAP